MSEKRCEGGRNRRKTGLSFMQIALWSIAILLFCSGCVNNGVTEVEGAFVYENLGLRMEAPGEWEGNCVIEEGENSIFVFGKAIYESEKFPGGGLLFSVERMTGELVTEEDMRQAPVRQRIILQGNGYTYIERMPSDVQYPPGDEALSGEYKKLSEQVSDVTYELIGDAEKPKAINDGFKVVGGTFFTAEIPEEWEIAEEGVLYWGLSDGGVRIGGISFIPYGRGNGSDANMSGNEWVFQSQDEMFRREAQMFFDSGKVDENTAERIYDSFKFVGGAFTVIDLQSDANEYLYRDGKRIFGTIEGFDMDGERPVAVRVNVMEFVPDGPDDENPNGFRIEDLNTVETYSLDFGVRVATLVPPDYNAFGTYEMPMMDEQFLKEYEDYSNGYYDFIIASDGNLKMVLGRYIP